MKNKTITIKIGCWLIAVIIFLINVPMVRASSGSYIDDFDGGWSKDNWVSASNVTNYEIKNDRLYITLDSEMINRRLILKGIDWSDKNRVEVMTKVEKGTNAGVGVVFFYKGEGNSAENERFMIIPQTKKYRAMEITAESFKNADATGGSAWLTVFEGTSEAIKDGENKIVVERLGSNFKFFINDVLVKELVKDLSTGAVGLISTSSTNAPGVIPAEASFDYIKITKGDVGNNCPLGNKGDINCDNKINKDDFETWKASFLEAQKNVSQLIKKIKYLAWK